MRVKQMPNLLLLEMIGFHWIGMHLVDFPVYAKLGALRTAVHRPGWGHLVPTLPEAG